MDGNDDVEALYFSFSFTTAEEEEDEDLTGEAGEAPGKPRSPSTASKPANSRKAVK